MLKKEKYVYSKLLKQLINESINQSHFPTSLKTAIVIPIFKKGDQTNLNNYRPISLLPVLSKVFEKVINKQINTVINNGYIDENQFGFREGHSTEDAVLKFVDKIEKDLVSKKHVVSIYVDVSKAFDSCDHGIILNKLKRTGLSVRGCKLLELYLKDRKQIVMVDGYLGGSYLINIGVGQGTVLGPTFFKVYIMDLHLHTTLFCCKFADDSSFEASDNCREVLQDNCNQELEKIYTWFRKNKLKLHPDKSRYLIHSKDKLINLKLGNNSIQRSGYGLQEESVRMLGVEIDENLDWKIHTKKVEKKISKANYLLWRHGKKLSNDNKKLLYESFVRSHLLYCITAWGGANLNQLNKTVKKIWRKIGKRKQHTLHKLKENGILKIEDELEVQETKIVWKWEKDKLPPGSKQILVEKNDNLRGRRFERHRRIGGKTINARLAKRAELTIEGTRSIKTKKAVVSLTKKKIIDEKYNMVCRNRACYICQEQRG